MSRTKNVVAAIAAVSMTAMPVAGAFAATVDDVAQSASNAGASAVLIQEGAQDIQAETQVEGTFTWDQATITPNEVIKSVFQKATIALCNAASELTVTEAEDWTITVSGDVQQAYTATLGELADDDENTAIMGCTCVSNGAGGPASINAEVTGVPLATIIAKALPSADANTVTLVSEDGYQTSLPLSYVMSRNAVVTYEINGEDLSASVGGTNQLWIDSTAAKYFTRNIVEVKVTHEEVVPAAPGTEAPADGEYVNRPNAGITAVQ